MLIKNRFRAALVPAAIAMLAFSLSSTFARAETLDYTFSGTGSGTISGNTNTTFSNAAFTVTFSAPTTAIIPNNPLPGDFDLIHLNGTFSEGTYTATLADAQIYVDGMGRVDLFDRGVCDCVIDSGIGLKGNSNVLGYELDTPVDTGLVSGLDLTPTNGTGGFRTTGGDVITFSDDSSLEFVATVPGAGTSVTPEPGTLVLLTSGMGAVGILRRKMKR